MSSGAAKHNVADLIWRGPGEEVEILSLNIQESISDCYMIHAHIKSPSPSLSFGEMLKAETQIVLMAGPDLTTERIFSGIITRLAKGRTRFGQLGTATGQNYFYDVEIRPKFWLLTKRFRSKVFQNMTVQDIVKEVIGEYGITDQWQLKGSLLTHDYIVQYEETDYNFVTRLLETEGLWFYFDQENAKVVFCNDHSARPDCTPTSEIPYIEEVSHRFKEGKMEFISDFSYSEEVGTAKYVMDHYNHETSQTSINSESNEGQVPSFSQLESYEHSQNYKDASEGDFYTGIRKEEALSGIRRGWGNTSCRSFEVGYMMQITDHFRGDLNGSWFLTQVNITAEQGKFQCHFACIQADVVYRAPRKTPIPRVLGFQTATVTGPPGAKVYLDDLGRCKIQFHWDREGEENDRSSMWVRVSNGYAGKDYGMQFIPRVGHEVLVNFVDGNPDLPIVMGRVYNDFNGPPLGPTKKYQNIIKSIKDNHLMFDDTDSKEKVDIRAQKDMSEQIINDLSISVGHDMSTSVGNDQTLTVGGNQTSTITKDQTVNVIKNQTQNITMNRTTNVTQNSTENVTQCKTLNVTQDLTANVTRKLDLNVQNSHQHMESSHIRLTNGNYNLRVDNGQVKIYEGSNGLRLHASALSGKHGTKIELQVGASQVKIENSKVTVEGPAVDVTATG